MSWTREQDPVDLPWSTTSGSCPRVNFCPLCTGSLKTLEDSVLRSRRLRTSSNVYSWVRPSRVLGSRWTWAVGRRTIVGRVIEGPSWRNGLNPMCGRARNSSSGCKGVLSSSWSTPHPDRHLYPTSDRPPFSTCTGLTPGGRGGTSPGFTVLAVTVPVSLRATPSFSTCFVVIHCPWLGL